MIIEKINDESKSETIVNLFWMCWHGNLCICIILSQILNLSFIG